MLNRRNFLITTSALALSTALSPLTKANKVSFDENINGINLNKLTSYTNKVGDIFLARSNQNSFSLTLTDIKDVIETEQLQQFTLVFKSKDNVCHDDIYSTTHLHSLSTETLRLEQSLIDSNKVISTFCLLK